MGQMADEPIENVSGDAVSSMSASVAVPRADVTTDPNARHRDVMNRESELRAATGAAPASAQQWRHRAWSRFFLWRRDELADLDDRNAGRHPVSMGVMQ